MSDNKTTLVHFVKTGGTALGYFIKKKLILQILTKLSRQRQHVLYSIRGVIPFRRLSRPCRVRCSIPLQSTPAPDLHEGIQ